MIKRIAIYCGSASGNDPIYAEHAKQMAQLLFHKGIGIVYGGGNIGLMGVLADEMIRLGGEIIGVIPRILYEREVAHQHLTELIVVEDMHERKMKMFNLSDAVIAMPGGIGTMEELFEAYTWHQIGIHPIPCGVLNVNHYYDLLHDLLQKMVDSTVLKPHQKDMLFFHHNAEILLAQLHYALENHHKSN